MARHIHSRGIALGRCMANGERDLAQETHYD